MKGIILAGGAGTRLYPLTKIISKQLLPVYNKPMIYYPLSVLMLSGIKDILIISNQEALPDYEKMFGDGSQLGLNINYKLQPSPDGLAQAFILGEEFIGGDSVCLVLGDNIIYGHGLAQLLKNAMANAAEGYGTIFGYGVKDPERFGVIEIGENGKALSVEEKPKNPKSKFAVIGLYFYPNEVVGIAKNIKPSGRGELEITSVNEEFLKKGRLKVELMGRGYAWFDAGTHDSLLECSQFIQAVETRQNYKIACLEEIACNMGYIDGQALKNLAEGYKNEYGEYLKSLIK